MYRYEAFYIMRRSSVFVTWHDIVCFWHEYIRITHHASDFMRRFVRSLFIVVSTKQFKTDVSRVIGAEGKYLRLISAGKMLNPDEAQVKDFGLTENCYVHCVVTAAPPRLHLPSLTPAQAEEEVGISELSSYRVSDFSSFGVFNFLPATPFERTDPDLMEMITTSHVLCEAYWYGF